MPDPERGRIAVGLEVSPRKTFASALEWPGWSRAGRDEAAALDALEAARERYAAVAHVVAADAAYARQIGLRVAEPAAADRAAVAAMREAMLAVLRQPSDGTPIAGRRWPARYAARRIAWHALDHAWEIEDRSDPA